MIEAKTNITPVERFVHVGDTALSVAEWPGDGPPIVLVHGWGVAWQVWLSVAPLFAKQFRVIAFDLRGHGRSGRVLSDHQRITWAEDTVRLMEKLTPDGAFVIGHSLGGWVSLTLPSIAPGLARKIVSEDPYTGPNSLVGERARGDASRRSRPDPEFVQRSVSVEPIAERIAEQSPHYSSEIVERLATMQFRMDPELIRGRGTRSEPERSHDEAFSKVNCPVLLMHGNPDKGGIMEESEAARVAGIIQDIRVVHWPHTGHNLHVARNFDFVKFVRKFLLAD